MVDDIEQRFPYQCQTRWTWTEVADWCEANVGQFDQDWYRYGSEIMAGLDGLPVQDTYRFRTEQAAVLFRLKWS
jgi:hypothetical protein